jgi:hypothetical protein
MWIGYLFAEQAWGRGYRDGACERVIAACRAAHRPQLRAGVAIGNPASMHVLRKAGFREIRTPEMTRTPCPSSISADDRERLIPRGWAHPALFISQAQH